MALNLTLGDRIGAGAAGKVWEAVDEGDRKFAVKFFLGARDSSERNALEHANNLVRVRHTSVVRVHSIQKVEHPESGDEEIALVMELIHGKPLSQCHGNFTLREAASFVWQLSDGLRAIHLEGLVHGDLHSGNVVLAGDRAKIIDLSGTPSLASDSSSAGPLQRDDITALAALAKELFGRVEGLASEVVDGAFEKACAAPDPWGVASEFIKLDPGAAPGFYYSSQLTEIARTLERTFRRIAAIANRRVPELASLRSLFDAAALPDNVREFTRDSIDLLSRIVTGESISIEDSIVATERGRKLLSHLLAQMTAAPTVVGSGIRGYTDQECLEERGGFTIVLLMAGHPGTKAMPTTLTYRIGQEVTWSLLAEKKVPRTYYRDPRTNQPKLAWDEESFFVGRLIE